MHLTSPSTQYKQSYLEAVEESKDEVGMTTISKPDEGQSFEEFVQHKLDQAKGLNVPAGWVPATQLWLVEGNEFIGWVSIRHELNEHLRQIGGHIGYWIRPLKRKMGYGNNILKLALLEAKKLGIAKALVTCDETNIGSQKIIEANRGVLENIVYNGDGHPKKKRFWIDIN